MYTNPHHSQGRSKLYIVNGHDQIPESFNVSRSGLSIAYTLLERDVNITVAITDQSGFCEKGATGAGAAECINPSPSYVNAMCSSIIVCLCKYRLLLFLWCIAMLLGALQCFLVLG